MKKYKVMVVGCGSIGLRHLRTLCLNRNVLIAALDNDEKIKSEVELISNEIQYFQDYGSAAGWGADLVIVATPNMFHRSNCLWAFENGANVLCEKPLAISVEEGKTMISAAEKAGKILGVGYTERYRSAIETIITESRSGEMGTLAGGRAMVGTYMTLLCARHPQYRAETFGSLILDYTHELDILAAIFGNAGKVECFGNMLSDKKIKAVPSLIGALIKYEKSEIVSLHFDYIQDPQRRMLEIYGSKKSLVYDWNKDRIEIYCSGKQAYEVLEFKTERDKLFVKEHDDMLNAIAMKKSPRVSGEEALRSLAAAEKMIACLKQGGLSVTQ